MRAPAEVAVGRELTVVVRARSEHAPQAVHLDILLGEADSDELAVVGTLATDATGRGQATLAGQPLGRAGRKRLEVRFAGDDAFDQASADAALRILAVFGHVLADAAAPAEREAQLAERQHVPFADRDGSRDDGVGPRQRLELTGECRQELFDLLHDWSFR